MRSTAWLLGALVLGLALPVHAQDAHRPRRHAVMHEQVVGLLNPMGAENRLDAAVRTEMGDEDDLFTQGTHVEAGVSTSFSPVYGYAGGYLQVCPLSFLVLRADVQGAGVWPIGMDGAGYYGVSSYGADVRGQSLAADEGRSASGWLAQLTLTLQGALDLGGGARVLLASELGIAREQLGERPYYDSMRHDAVMAREDTIVLSSSFVGVELPAAPDLIVRWGAYDDLRYVPDSGYVGHQLGPLAMLEWHHVTPEIASLAVFVRGGGYTHHMYRTGEATILAGLAIDFDLGDL